MELNRKDKHYTGFTNRACEYFPCHSGVPEKDFNCLFCYCPLYALGRDCGGAYQYTPDGIKDCSGCVVPHRAENYGEIMDRLSVLQKRMQGED